MTVVFFVVMGQFLVLQFNILTVVANCKIKDIVMLKIFLITCAFATTFCLGFTFRNLISEDKSIKRVTGIGGIFFKCKNPKKVKEWYKKHLGLNTNDYGCVFEWYQGADSTRKGFSQWSTFNEKTKYFDPSTKEFMINYRVDNLELLIDSLKQEGITIVDTLVSVDYGKFIHILDLEGNKIELWEPYDIEFEKLGYQIGAKTTK